MNHRVLAFEHTGAFVGEFGSYGEGMHEFRYPVGVVTWSDFLIVADEESKRLRVFNRPHEKDDFPPDSVLQDLAAPWLRSPFGMAINRENRLAVTDRDQRCVWIIDLETALP
jgi:hypothetical protein